MESNELEYRGHKLSVRESGSANGRRTYDFSIEKRYLGTEHYSFKYSSCYSSSEAANAGREAIDMAFASVERQATIERTVTKNDFDGFVALLANSNIPTDQIPTIAIEMLKAHYQRLSINDNSDIAQAIDELGSSIIEAFRDEYGISLATVLSRMAETLEKSKEL